MAELALTDSGRLNHKVVTHSPVQLAVWRRIGKVRRHRPAFYMLRLQLHLTFFYAVAHECRIPSPMSCTLYASVTNPEISAISDNLVHVVHHVFFPLFLP